MAAWQLPYGTNAASPAQPLPVPALDTGDTLACHGRKQRHRAARTMQRRYSVAETQSAQSIQFRMMRVGDMICRARASATLLSTVQSSGPHLEMDVQHASTYPGSFASTTVRGVSSAAISLPRQKSEPGRCNAADSISHLGLRQQAHKLPELVKVDVVAGVLVQQRHHPRAVLVAHLHHAPEPRQHRARR